MKTSNLPMANRNRVAWGLAAVLAVVVLGGIGLLLPSLRAYWVARYRGMGANLRGAMLPGVPLPRVNLTGANLGRANLDSANLQGADLNDAKLQGAKLRGATLTGADLTGARYDVRTRWPKGFDPLQHGAILVR